MQAVIDAIGATGFLKIGTAGMALILATVPLANPCGTVSGGVITFTVPQTDPFADASGTAAEAAVSDGTTDIITGMTVGLSGTDVIVPSTSFTLSQTVTLTLASLTHG